MWRQGKNKTLLSFYCVLVLIPELEEKQMRVTLKPLMDVYKECGGSPQTIAGIYPYKLSTIKTWLTKAKNGGEIYATNIDGKNRILEVK